MIDRRKIGMKCPGEITEVVEDGDQRHGQGRRVSKAFEKGGCAPGQLRLCIHRNPVIRRTGGRAGGRAAGRRPLRRRARLEAMSPSSAGNTFFDDLLAPCIRCYACRNACPLCYCPTCFVDEAGPSGSARARTRRMSGRFTFCGPITAPAAARIAAPASGPARWGSTCGVFTKKLEKDCLDLFGWEAGLSLEVRPPLDTYRPQDPNDFIK
jgi:formate dehydrogenase (coenzyme F420) beta subunit